MDCWRPTIDDVDRISWGRPAKKKGTGSRGTPHRLNDEERAIYDRARQKGFVEIAGSGWRKQRSAAPLVNTYRSWCDANGHPAIYIHKANDGNDELVVDLSPLRTPADFEAVATYCLASSGCLDGAIEFDGSVADAQDDDDDDVIAADDVKDEGDSSSSGQSLFRVEDLVDAYRDEPIYRVPMYAVVWTRQRADAKSLAKTLAGLLGTADARAGGKGKGGGASKANKGRRKERGAPDVKPGKSRRHGGYGIG